MRTIKFRAWDISAKCMIYNIYIRGSRAFSETQFILWNDNRPKCIYAHISDINGDRYELLEQKEIENSIRRAANSYGPGSLGAAFFDAAGSSIPFDNVGTLTDEIMPDSPIMQYTGLKDKNSKEIYEGDIIRPLQVTNGEPHPQVVQWENEGAAFRGYRNYRGISILVNTDKRFEVIGNIYENPELLTNSKAA